MLLRGGGEIGGVVGLLVGLIGACIFALYRTRSEWLVERLMFIGEGITYFVH